MSHNQLTALYTRYKALKNMLIQDSTAENVAEYVAIKQQLMEVV